MRDKLLGRESNDIDVALDTMLGREFADKVNAYLLSQGQAVSGVGVIHANPEQSKHLETATMCVHGTWLDLVHLRSESYSEGSRIPESVSFGSPEQDALRRDLTFNALFYNLNTRTVEDCTRQGLDDLRCGVARTPQAPMQTLLDDPLRALRAVRLATRLAFTLADDLQAAASTPELRVALGSKVSKERVGVELEGMIKGPAPVSAIHLLCSLGMAPVVFALPDGVSSVAPPCWPWASLHSVDTLVQVLRAMQPPAAHADAASLWRSLSEEERRWAVLAGVCAPLRHVVVAAAVPGGGAAKKPGRPVSAVQHIVRESLKLRGRDAEQVARLLESAHAFCRLAAQPEQPPSRAQLGRLLRTAKAQWRVALAVAAALRAPGALALSSQGQVESPQPLAALRDHYSTAHAAAAFARDDAQHDATPPLPPPLADAAAPFQALALRCDALQLDGVWDAKPLLTGLEVQHALGIKAGPALGPWLDALVSWELEHPGEGKEQALVWLAQAAKATAPPASA